MRTRDESLKIHMTRVSDMFLTRHGSMIGVFVLHRLESPEIRIKLADIGSFQLIN